MTTSVDTPSAAVAKMAEAWPMIDALVGGTGAMRAAGRAFLPQFPAEPDKSYEARLKCATLFPAFSRTSEVLAAKPLSKAIKVENFPAELEDLLENIDGEGSTLHAYAASLMLECMRPGLVGVLVDVPPAEGVRTKADEDAAGIRPYCATYKASSILECTKDRVRLLENVTEPDGDWGEKIVKQVRVLTPGKWAVYRKKRNDATGEETWQIHDQGEHKIGGNPMGRIPFVVFYGVREGYGMGRPPLLDLAYLNCEHYQSASDQQTILHVARVPILYATGFGDDDQLTVGASSFVKTTNADAKIGYAEHSGAAIGAGRDALKDLEDRMRQTGAELLVQRPNIATATQTVSEGEGSKSILQRIVENFEESLEDCLELMGEWRGQKFECEVSLYKDFGAAALGEQTAQTILAAVAGRVISPETGFKELQRRDLISPDVEWEEEAAKIAAAAPMEPEDAKPGMDKHDADENAADGLKTED